MKKIITKKNTAILISADIKKNSYRFFALKSIIKYYKKNYNVYIALVLRGTKHNFNVDLQVSKIHSKFFTKEKDWNYLLDFLPENIEYVFFSDADCVEAPGQKLLDKCVINLKKYNLDGVHCFSDIIYLTEYSTQKYYKTGEVVNDFAHKKSGSNGGWASGGLLLFKKEYIKRVKFIDYCWLGAGDTINMVVFMSKTMNTNFSEIWNKDLLEDIQERKRRGIRFGRINATLMHLFHRSPELNFNKFRRMFYGQITKRDVDFNEKLGEPYIEWVEQIKLHKKYIYKGMKVIDLINLFYNLREGHDDMGFPFTMHDKKVDAVLLSDTYPLKIL